MSTLMIGAKVTKNRFELIKLEFMWFSGTKPILFKAVSWKSSNMVDVLFLESYEYLFQCQIR